MDPFIIIFYSVFLVLSFAPTIGSWIFGNWHQGRILDRLASEEKALNDSGAGHPINNLSNPTQSTDIENSTLVMSSISVGPSWWQMMLGGWKNFFGGKIHSYDKMLGYGRRKVLHDMRVQALQQGFDEVINIRVETAMITKKSGKNDKTAAYEFIAYGTAIKYVRS
ncbi:MAG: YbjQ family protein [Candidatus Poseidoniaceae archaeon]